MSAAVKCEFCQDTGSLPGSHDLDCASCGAAVERAAFDKWAFDNLWGSGEDAWRTYQHGKAVGAALAADSDNQRMNFIEANPDKVPRKHKRQWACVTSINYEYDVFKTAREAIDAARKA